MSVAIEPILVTPEQLLAMPEAIGYELVDGELRDRHLSSLSSWVGTRLTIRLGHFVEAQQLGWVFSSDNGYQCFPHSPKTIRRPDASFIKLDRLKAEEIGVGWLKLVPDLVVEVVSPNDTGYEVEAKIELYRKVGVPLIWVFYPPTRTVRVIRGDGSSMIIRHGEELLGEVVVPGFRCPVAELFLPATPEQDGPANA